jgi:cell division protein FtsB
MVSSAVRRFALVHGFQLLYCFPRVPKAEIRSKTKRRTPVPKRTGRQRQIVHWFLLFVAAIIIVDALVGDRGLLAMLRARKEYDQLAATIARERTENARLREEARRLRDDPAAIEEIARRELGLIRPGEKVFIVKDVAPPSPSVPPTTAPPPASDPHR